MQENHERKEFQDAINHRLSGLEGNPWLAQRIMTAEKGEPPVMKKKLSVSFILVLLAMALTVTAAMALMQSQIADRLFGGEENVPEEIINQIYTPEATASTEYGTLSIDEVLYDGAALHTVITVANQAEKPMLYTIERVALNGMPLDRSNLCYEGAGSAGSLLGGEVDGAALPDAASMYSKAEFVYSMDAETHRVTAAAIPEGKAELAVTVAVWEPVNQPKLVDYSDYEGADYDANANPMNCLTVDATGYCDLWMFRPSGYRADVNVFEASPQDYAAAFEALGWAKQVGLIELETEVNISRSALTMAVPAETVYELDGCTLTIDDLALSHAGGECVLTINGEYDAVKEWSGYPLYLVDADKARVLTDGCHWNDQTGEGVQYTLLTKPMTGELPERVYLARQIGYNNAWDKNSRAYDPSVERPAGVIGSMQFDFDTALAIDMQISQQ